jgi:hypothetical protein
MLAQLRKLFIVAQSSYKKNWEFLEEGKASIFNFHV